MQKVILHTGAKARVRRHACPPPSSDGGLVRLHGPVLRDDLGDRPPRHDVLAALDGDTREVDERLRHDVAEGGGEGVVEVDGRFVADGGTAAVVEPGVVEEVGVAVAVAEDVVEDVVEEEVLHHLGEELGVGDHELEQAQLDQDGPLRGADQ